jgi:WD40 repeat protein
MPKSLSIVLRTSSLGHNAPIYSLFFDENRQTLYSGAGDGWVVEWKNPNFDTGHLIAKIEGSIFCIHKLQHQPIILAGTLQGGIYWINIETKEVLKSTLHHSKSVFFIHSQNGKVYTLGGDGKITEWDTTTYFPIQSRYISHSSLRQIKFHPLLPQAAIAASDGNIYIIDLSTLEVLQIIQAAHLPSVFTLEYSADGAYLWSGGRDALLKYWDISQKYTLIKTIKAHLFTINDIAISPDKQFIATASRDKTIKIWDYQSLELLKVIDAFKFSLHRNSVNSLVWTTDSLISASDDRTIAHWTIG